MNLKYVQKANVEMDAHEFTAIYNVFSTLNDLRKQGVEEVVLKNHIDLEAVHTVFLSLDTAYCEQED